MKTCIVCQTAKPLDDFHRDKANKDGHRNTCKECAKAARRQWVAENPERAREHTRAWQRANPEKLAAAQHRRYWADPEKSRAKGREYARQSYARKKARRLEKKSRESESRTDD